MVAAARSHNCEARSRLRIPRSFWNASVSAIAVVFANVGVPAFAVPLASGAFNSIASSCAAGVETSTLRAVARVESHFDPLALRDDTTGEVWAPRTAGAATTIAEARLAKRHSVDLGLMQINSANLVTLRLKVSDAFDACHSLAAARDILRSAFAAGSSETDRQAAILISLSRYNTGRPLAGIANGYADKVMMAQGAADTAFLQTQSEPASQWDIWGSDHAVPSSWILTANEASEFRRAGARTSDARREGRAPAITSEKGEPYEVSAYRESEASQQ